MRRFLEWFKKEFVQYIGSAIFFAAAFCLIALANKLMVAGSEVHVASFARAIIGGLIVAKLLFFVDLVPGVNAFHGKPLIFNILWKTPIYLIMSLVYRYLEPVIGSVVAGVSVAEAHAHASRGVHPSDVLGDRGLARGALCDLRHDARVDPCFGQGQGASPLLRSVETAT